MGANLACIDLRTPDKYWIPQRLSSHAVHPELFSICPSQHSPLLHAGTATRTQPGLPSSNSPSLCPVSRTRMRSGAKCVSCATNS